jgi:hypothetical protein
MSIEERKASDAIELTVFVVPTLFSAGSSTTGPAVEENYRVSTDDDEDDRTAKQASNHPRRFRALPLSFAPG